MGINTVEVGPAYQPRVTHASPPSARAAVGPEFPATAATAPQLQQVYTPWNMHEPYPGQYVWSGMADLERWMELIQAGRGCVGSVETPSRSPCCCAAAATVACCRCFQDCTRARETACSGLRLQQQPDPGTHVNSYLPHACPSCLCRRWGSRCCCGRGHVSCGAGAAWACAAGCLHAMLPTASSTGTGGAACSCPSHAPALAHTAADICAEWDNGGFPHWFASSKVG